MIRKKVLEQNVKGNGYRTISRQPDVLLNTVANIQRKFKVHGSIAKLPGCGHKRRMDARLNRRTVKMVDKLSKRYKLKSKVEVQDISV